MIKHFCDRCNKVIHKMDEKVFVEIADERGNRIDYADEDYELCPECYKELLEFLGV